MVAGWAGPRPRCARPVRHDAPRPPPRGLPGTPLEHFRRSPQSGRRSGGWAGPGLVLLLLPDAATGAPGLTTLQPAPPLPAPGEEGFLPPGRRRVPPQADQPPDREAGLVLAQWLGDRGAQGFQVLQLGVAGGPWKLPV